MVTIKDVATGAGVSIKTASRVMNDSAEVSETTRRRVQQVISEMNYRPSVLARRLVSGKTNTVGVVIPYSASYVFGHFYFNEVLRGIGDILGQRGLDLLLHLGREQVPYSELYRKHQVDGLILLAIPTDDPLYRDLIGSSIPCVFTCRVTDHNNPTHWVDSDSAAGVEQAVGHLISLGHERLGMLAGPQNLVLAQQQVIGFRRAMASHALEVHQEWIHIGDYSFEAGEQIAKDLLAESHPPTALVCADDMMAMGAIRGATTLGLNVPQHISITGFDDAILAKYSLPALTTVRQDGYQKGRIAAETLMDVMCGIALEKPRQCLLATELVVRDTTAPCVQTGVMPMT